MDTIVVGKLNRNIYLVLKDDLYRNLSNDAEGRIRPEDAKRLFTIPLILNDFVMRNPLLVDLIREGGFIYEGVTKTTTHDDQRNMRKDP